MLGNFTFHNPTKLHFGEDSLSDQVMAELKKAGCEVVEIAGVMPNPTIEKVLEGAHTARKENVDFILGVGGGSTVDYCKAVAGSAWYDGDPWEYYFKNWQPMTCRWIPVGCVLTMAGTGSEMDSCSVISSHSENRKLFYNFRNPDFSILNPRFTFTVPKYQMVAGIYDIMSHILEQYLSGTFTFTVPKYQMVAGIYDIMSHILEQYLSGTDDNTSDYIAEGLMRSLIVSSGKAIVNPEDYEARSNIMWTATWALNTLIDRAKATDWMVHMLGQAVAAFTDATHGHTLAAVSGAYYRLLINKSDDAVQKFKRLAMNVWNVSAKAKTAIEREESDARINYPEREQARPKVKTDKQVAMEGLEAMEQWMRELGLAMNITDCGAKPEQIEGMADACPICQGGYYILNRDEVVQVLKESL